MRFRTDSRALREFLHYSRPYWAVGLIFAVTLAAVTVGPVLPQSFAGLRTAGPYAVLVTAMGLAWWFNRGRGFVIAASILLGWILMHHFPGKAVYTAAVVLMPLNCLVAVVGPERGVRYGAGYRWLAILAVEAVVVFWFRTLPSLSTTGGCARRPRRSWGGSCSPPLWSRPCGAHMPKESRCRSPTPAR